MDQNADIFPAYRLVAQFADGQRLTFDGLTEQQAQTRMEAAQALHGDICWYDGVTDQHYENGHFYKLTPPPPTINMIDLTDYHEKEECPCPYVKASAATMTPTTPNATTSAFAHKRPSAMPSAPPPRPPGRASRRMCSKPALSA